jgi:hypothetical protein
MYKVLGSISSRAKKQRKEEGGREERGERKGEREK